ncbi:MAG TPA: NAD(P)H:quinone oxidoreductase [Salinimicrobium catena]|uniref:NAD(P)H:quinone oxidoreductase n=1 Tax=Salinimicrobium catena TaxID=390640 RepID=A0A7C2M5P3_9FLAO|nr:NAD(P)H:quinone oxidoreductase [Salinimicrobium catena]
MKDLKIAVIYYSSTGTNYQLAQWAEEAAKEAGVGEVRLRKVKELAPKEAIAANEEWKKHVEATKDVEEASIEDLEWADAVIFSTPTRYGNLPSQFQQFLDLTGGLWSTGKLANKVVTGMTSASNPHGGQESTLLALYKTMHHWGSIVAAPGYTDGVMFKAGGNPYGVSVTAGKDNLNQNIKAAVEHQVRRTLKIAGWVVAGK